MDRSIYFYGCKRCGNIAILLNDGFGTMKCCNEPMKLVVPKSCGENSSSHLPCISKYNGSIYVQVGSIPHKMIDIHHYIKWIALVSSNHIEVTYLKLNDEPKAIFQYKEPGSIYCFCNIHGLWRIDFN